MESLQTEERTELEDMGTNLSKHKRTGHSPKATIPKSRSETLRVKLGPMTRPLQRTQVSKQPVRGQRWTRTPSPESHRRHRRASLHGEEQLLREGAAGVADEGHRQGVDVSRGNRPFLRTHTETAPKPAGWPGQPEGGVNEPFIRQPHLRQKVLVAGPTGRRSRSGRPFLTW